jgi:UDP-N-acetylmuramate--alanine ligase
MIGIGGCGMSALGRMLLTRGAIVSGSDMTRSEATDALSADGVAVSFDQQSGALPEACDMVVASAAIKPDHPEVLAAESRGIEVLSYAEALGRCMLGRTGIAVAGTHGKSTTVAMLGAALVDAGLDPTVVVGATCRQLADGTGVCAPTGPVNTGPPTGFRLGADVIPTGELAGRPGLLAAEACEYNRSFHHLRPTVAAIGSVEADHLDVYGSLDAVIEAFADFARLLPPATDGGILLIAHEGAHRREVTRGLACRVETIGFSPSADWIVSYTRSSRRVTLTRGGMTVAEWVMAMPGEHNAMNAAVAGALAILVGADPARVAASLGAFMGLDRRAQYLGKRHVPGGSVRVYDDYGHHPTEIEATLNALRQYERLSEKVAGAQRNGQGGGRLVCVFQPHQHSRTRFFLDEFASAFSSADVVIVPDIYFVRDSQEEKQKVSAADLVDRLRSRGVRAMHIYPFEAIVEQLGQVCRAGDLLVTMGAGPVWKVARGYLDVDTDQPG